MYAVANGGLTLNAGMNVLRHSAVIGTIAIGMGIVCLTGEIDLSVGSMLALVAGFSVVVFNMTDSIPLTLLFALLFGAACGLLNGVLVGVVQMPAFIVTLATMLIYRSVAQYACQHLPGELIGNGSSVYRMSNELGSYDALYTFGNARVAGVPKPEAFMRARNSSSSTRLPAFSIIPKREASVCRAGGRVVFLRMDAPRTSRSSPSRRGGSVCASFGASR